MAETAQNNVEVSAPGLPGGAVFLKRYYNDDMIRRVVYADPRKLAKAWADDIRDEYRREHPLKAIFGGASANRELALYDRSPLEQSIAHMVSLAGKSFGVPMDMPQVNYYDGHFSFTNGIHRTFNLAKLGATSIPVEIGVRDDVEGFLKRFGVDAPQPRKQKQLSP